jgi:hypothetical protein
MLKFLNGVLPTKFIGFPHDERSIVEIILIITFIFILSFIIGYILDTSINKIIKLILKKTDNANSTFTKNNKLTIKETLILATLCIIQFVIYVYIIILFYENIHYNYKFTRKYLFSLLNIVGIAFTVSQKNYAKNVELIFNNLKLK